jgi:NADH-quinone oxidoreductase subunit M
MWPFHTWAPTGHVAAPTAASMLLAGVVMKLGAYGCLRVAIGLFPHGLDPWGFSFLGIGSWRDVFALLAVIGIVYGALVALARPTSSSSSATPASATWASCCSAS